MKTQYLHKTVSKGETTYAGCIKPSSLKPLLPAVPRIIGDTLIYFVGGQRVNKSLRGHGLNYRIYAFLRACLTIGAKVPMAKRGKRGLVKRLAGLAQKHIDIAGAKVATQKAFEHAKSVTQKQVERDYHLKDMILGYTKNGKHVELNLRTRVTNTDFNTRLCRYEQVLKRCLDQFSDVTVNGCVAKPGESINKVRKVKQGEGNAVGKDRKRIAEMLALTEDFE